MHAMRVLRPPLILREVSNCVLGTKKPIFGLGWPVFMRLCINLFHSHLTLSLVFMPSRTGVSSFLPKDARDRVSASRDKSTQGEKCVPSHKKLSPTFILC